MWKITVAPLPILKTSHTNEHLAAAAPTSITARRNHHRDTMTNDRAAHSKVYKKLRKRQSRQIRSETHDPGMLMVMRR
jgi:hypothetical protein